MIDPPLSRKRAASGAIDSRSRLLCKLGLKNRSSSAPARAVIIRPVRASVLQCAASGPSPTPVRVRNNVGVAHKRLDLDPAAALVTAPCAHIQKRKFCVPKADALGEDIFQPCVSNGAKQGVRLVEENIFLPHVSNAAKLASCGRPVTSSPASASPAANRSRAKPSDASAIGGFRQRHLCEDDIEW